MVPDPGDESCGESGDGTGDDAQPGFLEDESDDFVFGNFAHDDAAHHDGEGLGSGVAALAGDYGEEDGEDRELGDDVFEAGDDGGGEEGRGEVDEEPGQAVTERCGDGGEGTFVFSGAEHLLDIAGEFVLDVLDELFDADDTQQSVFGIDHGGGEVASFGEFGGGLFAIGEGVESEEVAAHDLFERLAGLGEHEVAHIDDADELVGIIEDVGIGEGVTFLCERADFFYGVADPGSFPEGEELGAHEAADAVFGELEVFADGLFEFLWEVLDEGFARIVG